MRQYPAYLYLFDLLYLDHYDVTGLPLEQRKRLLRDPCDGRTASAGPSLRLRRVPSCFKTYVTKGAKGSSANNDKACMSLTATELGQDQMPRPPRVCDRRVYGSQRLASRVRGALGGVLQRRWALTGVCGQSRPGYTRTMLLDLRRRLDALQQARSPFDQGDPPRGADVHWVTPALVAEIAFAEWTHRGKLRQPRFVGLRFDKRPQECRRERPQPPPTIETGDKLQHASPRQPDQMGLTGGNDQVQGLKPMPTNGISAIHPNLAHRPAPRTSSPPHPCDGTQSCSPIPTKSYSLRPELPRGRC